MFTYSPVETEDIFFNPNNPFNNTKGERSNKNKSSPSFPCNFIPESDRRHRFQQYHEASLKRIELKQELQRRHQRCAENERLNRERAEKQAMIKKTEECNALRRFYELKSAQFRNNHGSTSTSVSSSITCSITSSPRSTPTLSSPSSSKTSIMSIQSCNSIRKFQAAYKIHSFIKHYIEKRNTQKIISLLIKLRSIQNKLTVLKSIKLKIGTLTFVNSKNKILPISISNKSFLIYKESVFKVLSQLDNEFTDEFYLIRERRDFIRRIASNVLQELDSIRDSQFENFKRTIL